VCAQIKASDMDVTLHHHLPFPLSRRTSRSTLFPYTTLFRSRPPSACRATGRTASCRGSPRTGPGAAPPGPRPSTDAGRRSTSARSEEHTSELQSRENLVCRPLLEKNNRIVNLQANIHLNDIE